MDVWVLVLIYSSITPIQGFTDANKCDLAGKMLIEKYSYFLSKIEYVCIYQGKKYIWDK